MSAKYGKIFFYFVVFFFAQCALAASVITPLQGHLDGNAYITPSGRVNAGDHLTSLSVNVRSLDESAVAKVSDLALAVTPAPLTGSNQARYSQNTRGSTSEGASRSWDGVMKFTSKAGPSSYTVGGTVSGLAPGQSVTLGSNGGGTSLVNADGAFTLPNSFPYGSSYIVSVETQPADQNCTVANGSGAGTGFANVTNVTVTCRSTVGGTVSGLLSGPGVTLLINGGDALQANANGAFTFPTQFTPGNTYTVSAIPQNGDQVCTVSNASGTITTNVTNVSVNCRYQYAINATLTGLAPGQIVGVASSLGAVQLSANGTFTFPQKGANAVTYFAYIDTQPTAQTCAASGATTVVLGSYSGNIQVVCRSTVGGTISGWLGPSLTLLINGGDAVQVNGNGAFTFPTQFTPGTPYTVSAVQGDTNCTVGNASGTVSTNVTNVTVNCSYTYPATATLTGLAPGQTVTVSGPGTVQLSANGTFTFPQKVSTGSNYSASIATQPAAQTCTASGMTSVSFGSYSGNTLVICQSSVGGTVSGLAPGQSITLASSSAGTKVVNTNGAFTFPTSLTPGTSYTVSVDTQPTGQTCTVGNGSGAVSTNVTSITVVCGSTLGGTVSGLAIGQSVTLLNNGGDAQSVNANGTFAFSASLASGTAYSVTVGTQPTGQTCTVGNASGVITADITNVTVSCVSTYKVGGTVSGLAPGQSMTLVGNGVGSISMSSNGPFTFPGSLTSGSSYTVSVGTQPTGQACTVGNGSGMVSNNVTSITVTCISNYSVGGTASGLIAGHSVTLVGNGMGTLVVNANGTFTFPTALASGSSYTVSVVTQPAGQACTVGNGSGTVTNNVTNVTLNCTTNQPASIPTLSEWGLFIMSSLIALLGMRRRQRQ